MAKTDFTVIQSLDRGLELLGHMAREPDRKYQLVELAEHIGVDRSSAHRMLTTLMKHRLVLQDKDERGYGLGLGIYHLATALEKQLKLPDIINPYLRRLVGLSGETAHTVVRNGCHAVFVDSESAVEVISIYHKLGHVDELHSTAVGKSLLCQMNEDDLRELFGKTRLTRHTPRTIDSCQKLAEELALVRQRGYATDVEERVEGVWCIAAPIRNFRGRIICAVGISGPAGRMKEKWEKLIPKVTGIGREISEVLQGRGVSKA
ncbi:IclR family transcriptional regulator [Oscillatoria laete-virens NRMC-F 0139]|nr:IclR family transcriptional regulator [Oscillatoria laete-virens]MDL5053634.1 IclR family transcriptional regulator [Oscillatoria laete-virens NRMC-F 0139]